MKITGLAGPDCGHQRESAHYRPPPSLWHLIQIRNPRCTAPGCRMPATRCDDDHSLAFDKAGFMDEGPRRILSCGRLVRRLAGG